MRPIRSFLILLIFLVCLTGLHYIIPAGKLFPSIDDFIPGLTGTNIFSKDRNVIESGPENVKDSIYILPSDTLSRADTLPATSVSEIIDPLQGFIDTLVYSRGQIRVMYYGDSQIEGDRISSRLRSTLRAGHGGTGPGLFLPLMPVMYTNSVWIRSSSNWGRYNYLSYTNGEISHQNFGPFMVLCRFLPDGEVKMADEKAFVRIRPSKLADSTSSEYDILRMFYGNTEGEVAFVVKADENQVFSDTLRRGKGYYEITCSIKGAKDILLEFTGKVSPDIYGISIESKKGIIVDNIPQRGSAGLEFTMVNKENLRMAFQKLSPDLFILQYGLNIVKNVRSEYSYYEKGLGRQLALLKELSPATPILVLGLTDMAVKQGDSIRSYRNIPAIIEAQKKATIEAGVTFWDSYSAMGGESSIVKWANSKPPLARKDYAHFTSLGTDTLSKILSDDLFPASRIDTSRLSFISIKKDTVAEESPLSASVPYTLSEDESTIQYLLSELFRYNPEKPFIFSTAAFWLFFLFVIAGYSLIYKKLFLRNGYLFLVSLFFYYKSGGLFLLLLIFITLIDFSCGLLIHNSRSKSMRKFYILISIISNLGLLAYFKYTGFIITSINDLFGTNFEVYDFLAAFSNLHLGTSFNFNNIILPIGISFFTFQSLSYTFDVYRRKMEPVRNIVDFGFYVSFFPQLVAGPIVRASEFIPQLYTRYHLARREFSHALFLILKGLIKKIVISDFIANTFIDRVFDAPSIYSGFENLMAVYGYGLQIYCDFSGYTDIAIGLGLILGFRFPINFNSPYKASNISDFWKRWHISLARWLKDYLYIPLGGNRKGKIRTGINLLFTMLLGGLWHGAALRFIIWGALHGLGLIINRIWRGIFGDVLEKSWIRRALGIIITFHFVSFSWIFFRAPGLDSVRLMLRQIFENFSPGSYLTVIPAYGSAFLLIAAGYLIHFIPEKLKESYRGLFIRVPLAVQFSFMMLIAVLLYHMRSTDIVPFIYFRF